MAESMDGPLHAGLATAWTFDIADVLFASIKHHGHLWRLPTEVRRALRWVNTEFIRPGSVTWDAILPAGLDLVELIETKVQVTLTTPKNTVRGVFRCAKALDADGRLRLAEVLGAGEEVLLTDPEEKEIAPLEKHLVATGPRIYGATRTIAEICRDEREWEDNPPPNLESVSRWGKIAPVAGRL